MNISDIIEAVKAVKKFAQVITENEDVTKADMESLATLSPSIKDNLANISKWIGGEETC